MNKALFAALLFLIAPAAADNAPFRAKIRPITGELVTTDKPCGKDVRAAVWKYVFRKPLIEIAGAELVAEVGAMDARRTADRTIVGESSVTGFFDREGHKQTIAITVLHKSGKGNLVPVYLGVIDRAGAEVCSEKWLGSAEVL